MRLRSALAGMAITLVVLLLAGVTYLRTTHLVAWVAPTDLERSLARAARRLAIPGDRRSARNPVPVSPEGLREAAAHYADHCAVCHGNNGGGDTDMGRGLFPTAPDMRLAATQQLSDGELFYIIENGVRFTGMPGWSTGTQAGAESSWQLVHFIRHMPALTDEEIERLESQTPRSREDVRQELEEERFLRGERE